MRRSRLALAATAALSFVVVPVLPAAAEENAQDFMDFHKIEITFHEAATTKNLDLMLSLFANDATLTSGGKTYTGKDQVRSYWQAAGPFQQQNQWVAYTPAFRIKYTVEGDAAHLYFECLYVDKAANKIAAHTNSNDTLVRVGGKWLIKDMKAATVPEL
jgi:SnoaL-like domain